ncbi:hypothetical protein FXF53_29315 [Micromonospora sp. WP24]|uniref:hypothetical protein n=1 Tax=Micromonospora sp. WP24 TaxID=2604469 RepID=UPI0011D9E055|nr:hypothetical protein [Micromonospora sp. WP24]TYB91846.1 hypothetical protein FXF53_29315 [Micromonospora sp. WP24]
MFFYSNEHGSRVFFDEVGPPWPKHPCTDNSSYRERSLTPVGRSAPTRHSFVKAKSLKHLDGIVNRRLTSVGLSAWSPYSLLKLEIEDSETRLTLRRLHTLQPATSWTATSEVPLVADDVVFIKAQQMSYFDISRGEAVTVSVNHVGTTSAIRVRARLRDFWTRLTT